jgi:hypothetical protein
MTGLTEKTKVCFSSIFIQYSCFPKFPNDIKPGSVILKGAMALFLQRVRLVTPNVNKK